MLLGFDGTVGDLGSYWDAGKAVWQERAKRIWGALNEPIPFGAFVDSQTARAAGARAAALSSKAPPIGTLGVIRATSGAIGGLTRAGVGATQAIGHQLSKTAAAAGHGNIHDHQYQLEAVSAQVRLLERHGFIAQLVRSYGPRGTGAYFRGPTTFGTQTEAIVQEGVQKALSGRRPREELIICGYSRGGLAAINACNDLAARGQETNLLILFDPVDRAGGIGNCNISAAVHHCILVQRTGNTLTWKPYMRKVALASAEIRVPDVWLTHSRAFFGRMVDRDDKGMLTSGKLLSSEIDATHASFGGVPWTGDNPPYMSQAGDRAAAGSIASFVNKHVFELCGWPLRLALTQPMIHGEAA
jgi:hypothetical protein